MQIKKERQLPGPNALATVNFQLNYHNGARDPSGASCNGSVINISRHSNLTTRNFLSQKIFSSL